MCVFFNVVGIVVFLMELYIDLVFLGCGVVYDVIVKDEYIWKK